MFQSYWDFYSDRVSSEVRIVNCGKEVRAGDFKAGRMMWMTLIVAWTWFCELEG